MVSRKLDGSKREKMLLISCVSVLIKSDSISILIVLIDISDGIKLPNSCKEKILGVIIDNELKLHPHIRRMCKKAAQKLGVLNKEKTYFRKKRKYLMQS